MSISVKNTGGGSGSSFPNGTKWTQSNIKPIGKFDNYNNLWVLSSDGFMYSDDGKTWIQSNITGVNFNSIYYNGEIWVIGSTEHGLYYSTDGKTWTQSNVTNNSFMTIYYANDIWIAGSQYAPLYYSLDGKYWIQCSGVGEDYFNDIYYNNDFNIQIN